MKIGRKKIIFRMIGNHHVGMGHIYRTISVADEFHDHETLFLTDIESDLAIAYFSGRSGWFGAFGQNEIVARIASLEPDLVIFDSLAKRKRN